MNVVMGREVNIGGIRMGGRGDIIKFKSLTISYLCISGEILGA